MLEDLFSYAGAVAMVGWLGLIFLPGRPFVVETLARIIIPCAIAVLYIGLMALNLGNAPADGGFGSLAAVKSLFTVDGLLLAGWIHYLAFDLFVGSWEVSDSRVEKINHLLVVPCLALTFMAGPVGLLLYVIVKYLRRMMVRQPQEIDITS
jgi:hypothetical protein